MNFKLKIITLLFMLMVFACNSDDQIIKVKIKNTDFTLEIAQTLAEKRQGLMYRDKMPENHGMLFIYDKAQILSFWMKNTKIALSLAYISDDGTIREIHDLKPFSKKAVTSTYYVQYVLELNKGMFKKLGLKKGDKLDFVPYWQNYLKQD